MRKDPPPKMATEVVVVVVVVVVVANHISTELLICNLSIPFH